MHEQQHQGTPISQHTMVSHKLSPNMGPFNHNLSMNMSHINQPGPYQQQSNQHISPTSQRGMNNMGHPHPSVHSPQSAISQSQYLHHQLKVQHINK